MMKLIIAVLLIFPAPGGYCAQAETAPTKSRTLQALLDRVLREGEDSNVDAVNAPAFGLPAIDAPSKDMWVDAADAPDNHDHIFTVLVDKSGDKPAKPTAILFEISKEVPVADGKQLEGMGFRMNLKGKLQAAMKIDGIVGKLHQSPISTKGVDVQGAFKREMAFWLKDSVGLELKNK